MMKMWRLIVMMGWWLASATTLTAQIPMNFKPLTTLDGLPTNEVRRLFQDREGFLWVTTTNGLSVYDGYHIKT